MASNKLSIQINHPGIMENAGFSRISRNTYWLYEYSEIMNSITHSQLELGNHDCRIFLDKVYACLFFAVQREQVLSLPTP